jgi:hypothetical protein
MFENLTWNTETILILGIVTFVAFALLGLVIWNSKTNKQVKTLISIDDSLKHLDSIEPETLPPMSQTQSETIESQEPEKVHEPEPSDEVEVIEEIKEPESRANIGRSGRVYTKEELEVQIR